jgi:hypothetical protein
MAEKTLADKLKLKAGMHAAIANAPRDCGSAPPGVRIRSTLDGKFD